LSSEKSGKVYVSEDRGIPDVLATFYQIGSMIVLKGTW